MIEGHVTAGYVVVLKGFGFRLRSWLPAIFWCGLIFWLSAKSHIQPPDFPLPPYADKVVHVLLYGILSGLIYRALAVNGAPGLYAAIRAFVLSAAYGATDEFHQLHVPGRSADLVDWFADLAGASLVLITIGLVRGWIGREKN